jgi:hypothetical protein
MVKRKRRNDEKPPYNEKIREPKCEVTLWINDSMGGSDTLHTKHFDNLDKALDFAMNPHSADDLSDWEEDCFSSIGAETCSTTIKVWIYEDAEGHKFHAPVCIWKRHVWA